MKTILRVLFFIVLVQFANESRSQTGRVFIRRPFPKTETESTGRLFIRRSFPQPHMPYSPAKTFVDENIFIEKGTSYCNITLKNFNLNAITHLKKSMFLDFVKKTIRDIKKNNVIKSIEFIGWADGHKNGGIDPLIFKNIHNDCVRYITADSINYEQLCRRAIEY